MGTNLTIPEWMGSELTNGDFLNYASRTLAASGTALSSIGFDGDGILRSIFGNYVSGFSFRLR